MLQKQLNLYQNLGGQFQPESGGQFVPETWGSVSPGFRGSICVDFPHYQKIVKSVIFKIKQQHEYFNHREV